MFAVVDLISGRVITPNGFSHTSGVYFGLDDHMAFLRSQSEYSLLAFRKDSKLLIVLGDLDEDETREGAFYFVLDRQRLRLVHCTRVTKHCGNLRQVEAKRLPAYTVYKWNGSSYAAVQPPK